MNKTVILGDTHGRSFWKLILEIEKPTRVIFIGDYFDSREISGVEQIHNFKEIIQWRKDHPEVEVILLTGNHDYGYFNGIDGSQTSGYQSGIAPNINQVLEENKEKMQMCYKLDNILFSHAGIGRTWLQSQGWDEKEPIDEFVNSVWQYRPLSFKFYGRDRYGDDIYQTPIWIRPRSLMADCKKTLRNDYIQVVGHTHQESIDIKGKATGGRYYFIDTLGSSGEYLIYENNQFSVGKI